MSLLPFQYEIVQALNAADGLCILSTGLGWVKPVSAFVRAHAVVDNGGCVVTLGATPLQKETLDAELRRQDPAIDLPFDINSAVPALERQSVYTSKRCCCVTTRIFVVDLLAEKIQTDAFAGLIILNAEWISDNGGVEFAVRLFRLSNKTGFVRAFTDQPLGFTGGFVKAEKVMKALQVRSLSLWPRFQSTVKSDLDRGAIQVTEVTQGLTPGMLSIQESIKELMTALVEELQKTGNVDRSLCLWLSQQSRSGCSSEMTVETCLFKSFDEVIRRQLDPVWNSVSWKVKQLVQDLRQLRELLLDLMTHDAVTFLTFLERIQMTGGDSIWQFHDAAHDVFEQAKRRVYVLDIKEDPAPRDKKKQKQEPGTGRTASSVGWRVKGGAGRRAVLIPVLEPLPKWDALKDLLTELQKEIQETPAQSSNPPGSILVVCKQMFMKNQLKWAIEDPRRLLKELFNEYLTSAREMREISVAPTRASKKQSSTIKCDFSLYGPQSWINSAQLSPSSTPVETVALDKAAEGVPTKRPDKRKRNLQRDDPRAEEQDEDEAREEPRQSTASLLYSNEGWSGPESPLLQNVHFYPLDARDESILWTLQPDYVIMYHPDVAFVRQVELYQAENVDKPVKLYFIYYDNSIEQSTFQATVQRETDIFTNLIENKGKITIPRDVGDHKELSLKKKRPKENPKRRSKKSTSAETPEEDRRVKIIVDMREFMSKLPATLHRFGFKLFPLTLEVGDYVLTPDIVVERKTVSDLHSSMRSGRLFHQAEAMSKRYDIPMLLIEFDGDKQFRLQSDGEIGRDISSHSIISRLMLLVLHFPKLKLIWSPSTQTTCRIFNHLKRNRTEPEISDGPSGQQRRVQSEVVNEKAVDVLRKLPGVTVSNSRKLMASCSSLSEMAALSLDRLEVVMGSKRNAKALYSFLHAPRPRL